MFASREHYQLPRCYSKDHRDCLAVGNAFDTNWQREQCPYINPPWTDLLRVLQKIQKDQVRALMIAPEWPENHTWYPLWEKLVENSFVFYDAPYLDESGSFPVGTPCLPPPTDENPGSANNGTGGPIEVQPTPTFTNK